MKSNPVILHVYYTARPGQAAGFVRAMEETSLLAEARADAGCLQYEYFHSAERPDVLLLLERWESAEDLETHLARPHMVRLRELKDQYILHTDLNRYPG